MKVRFNKAAEKEFDAAAAFYEQESPGLGKRYREAIRDALKRIAQFPDAHMPLSQRTRRCLVRKFPYGIIYQVREDEIIVVAVAHLHRKPDYWKPHQ